MITTSEREFRAMGTDCHVVVVAPSPVVEELLDLAVERVELLEACWSRFRATSELMQVNNAAGTGPVVISEDLLLLVQRMHEAWKLSGGLFDPTVLSSMTALGYDTDFATVSTRSEAASLDTLELVAAPGMAAVLIDEERSTVALPAGVGIDPGAIGKGLASDVIAAELSSAGAVGVLVNLGGDLAFAGRTEDDTGWSIGVEDERIPVGDDARLLRVLEFPETVTAAGIATSTTLKRRWAQGRRHHLIDPRTGTMSTSDLVQVTVVADAAWQAEVTATTALLMPASAAFDWLVEQDVTAILLTADDELITTDAEAHTARGAAHE